jgi:hypothetical protein
VSREDDWKKKGCSWSPTVMNSTEDARRYCRGSASDFVVHVSFRAEGRKGDDRGLLGLFIGGFFLAGGARVAWIRSDG